MVITADPLQQSPICLVMKFREISHSIRSGRRGRAFESPLSDKIKGSFLDYSKLPFNFI